MICFCTVVKSSADTLYDYSLHVSAINTIVTDKLLNTIIAETLKLICVHTRTFCETGVLWLTPKTAEVAIKSDSCAQLYNPSSTSVLSGSRNIIKLQKKTFQHT